MNSANRINSADQTILQAMDFLEKGRYGEFEKCLNELDRLSHYARCTPSWKGMHNLTHIMRTMTTQILLDHHLQEKPKLTLERLT